MAMQKGLSGLRKAAIVSLLIGEDQSAEVLRHLREDELEKLAKEVAGLGHISAQLGETVLEEFHQHVVASEFAGRGDVVLTGMASLDDISPAVVRGISTVIEQRLRTLGGPSREQHGGVRAVAELFNRLERNVSAPVLEAIETQRPELAVSIRNLMFVFDDLVNVDDNGMREIVQRADKKALTIALKGASEEIRKRFFGNMSKRASEMLREEMEVLGAVRLRDVEKAQQDIVAIARKLEEEGVIVTGAAAGEAYVV